MQNTSNPKAFICHFIPLSPSKTNKTIQKSVPRFSSKNSNLKPVWFVFLLCSAFFMHCLYFSSMQQFNAPWNVAETEKKTVNEMRILIRINSSGKKVVKEVWRTHLYEVCSELHPIVYFKRTNIFKNSKSNNTTIRYKRMKCSKWK